MMFINHSASKFFVRCLAPAILILCSPMLYSADVTAIEEEWQLEVGTSNSAKSSPQVTTLISSTGDASGYHALLLVNHQGSHGGGIQLQLWNGANLIATGEEELESLSNIGEKIQWTTRMEVNNQGQLIVQVLNGSSTTWGKFGGKAGLVVSAPTSLSNLNGYDPNVTVANTGIDYGSQRVNKLVLRKIRVFTDNKKSVEQALERVVYQN